MDRAPGREPVTARAAIFGGAAAIILGACLLPLLWPTLALLSIGGGVTLGLLADPVLWYLLARTLAVAAAVLGLALMIGLPMAVLTARTDVAGRGVALVIHAFPALLPPFLPALGWFHLLGRQGLIGNDASAALLFGDVGVIFVLGLALAPIFTALTALCLWNIDPSQEEAGRVVASPMRVATRILLPASRPAIVLAGVVVAALTLSEVGVPTFLRARTYAAAVFAQLGGADFAPAEALLLTLPVLVLALALLGIERRAAGGRSFAALGLRSFRNTPMALGRWRAPATILCWSVAALSIAPIMALAWRAGSAGFAELPQWIGNGVINSLVPAAVAATVVVLVAVPIGHGIARAERAAAGLDAAALLAFVAPPALLGVGLVALWNRPETGWLYGSWLIVAVGYIGRYAVIGVRAFAVACAQAPSAIEEAARVFGAGYAARLARIVVPLHARALVGAWLLTLLFCLRDLETAVVFYPPDREPLAVRIFTLEANGPEEVVAALACVQAGMAALVLTAALPLLTVRAGR
jgi:iron(III) transport system permease protein